MGLWGSLSQGVCGLATPCVSGQGSEVTTMQGRGKATMVPQGLLPSCHTVLTAIPRSVAVGLPPLPPPPSDWPKPRALLPWACAHAWPSLCCR